jgi:hypothetical protein
MGLLNKRSSSKERSTKTYFYPKKKGRVWIYPQLPGNRDAGIVIAGDPDGLRYLARLCTYLADVDQIEMGEPPGERAHLHLDPGAHLGSHSWRVEIMRADASVTGRLPNFLTEPTETE